MNETSPSDPGQQEQTSSFVNAATAQHLHHHVLEGPISEESLSRIPPSIQSLEISSHSSVKLNTAAAKALAGAIPWKSLQRLVIQQQPKLGPRGLLPLAQEWHSKSTKLVELSLVQCRLGHFGMATLAPRLPADSLQKLTLADNGIGKDGAWKIAAALPSLVNLHYLDLSQNSMGDEGCSELVTHLPSNIRVLKLGHNQIANDGAKAIANALQLQQQKQEEDNNIQNVPVLEHMEEIYLQDNQIDDEGATALMEALDHCPSLTELDLHDNPVPASRWHVMTIMLRHRARSNNKNKEQFHDSDTSLLLNNMNDSHSSRGMSVSAVDDNNTNTNDDTTFLLTQTILNMNVAALQKEAAQLTDEQRQRLETQLQLLLQAALHVREE